MIVGRSESRTWSPTEYPGVEVSVLRQGESRGGAALVRFARGTVFPRHDHPGGEEVLVVQGRVVVGGVALGPGDYLWTPPGGIHDLEAVEDSLIFVTTPLGIRVLRDR